MKYVLFYDTNPDGMGRAAELFGQHQACFTPYAQRGELLLIGTLGNPATDGSMAVFTSREAAERFAAEDPFVREGVVAAWRVLDWNEALQP